MKTHLGSICFKIVNNKPIIQVQEQMGMEIRWAKLQSRTELSGILMLVWYQRLRFPLCLTKDQGRAMTEDDHMLVMYGYEQEHNYKTPLYWIIAWYPLKWH